MKIRTIEELSRFSSLLCQILKDVGVGVRLNSLRGHIAVALGFNTYNGMNFSFPNQLDITPQFIQILSARLKKHRGYSLSNAQLSEACQRAFSPKCSLGSFEQSQILRTERKLKKFDWRDIAADLCSYTNSKVEGSSGSKLVIEHFLPARVARNFSDITWTNLLNTCECR